MSKLFGKTRQGYYHWKKTVNQKLLFESLIVELISDIRHTVKNNRLGGKKLQIYINERLEKDNMRIGRDKLYSIMRENGLLVKRRKRRSQTTNSNHFLKRYPNLIKELKINGPEEVWVSDITYIRVGSGFNYLSLITDAYSRKLVGYSLQDNLSAQGPEEALMMALASREYFDKKLIHHSDQGAQYCSYDYISMLKANGVGISMSKKASPQENAIAERINGILKDEYKLNKVFSSNQQAQKSVEEAIKSYNEKRIHMSIEMQTPSQKHNEDFYIQPESVNQNREKQTIATSKKRTITKRCKVKQVK